jgi:hypothetical protein
VPYEDSQLREHATFIVHYFKFSNLFYTGKKVKKMFSFVLQVFQSFHGKESLKRIFGGALRNVSLHLGISPTWS